MCMYGNIIQMWISFLKMYSNLTKWLIDIEMHIKQEFWPTNLISHKVWCYLQIRTMPWFPNLNHQTTKIEKCAKDKKWWYKVFNEKYEKFIHDTWNGLEHM